MKRLTFFLLIVALLAIISSCRTVREVVEVPVEVHDTTSVAKVTHDSIFIEHFREVTQKNDTIYITDSIAVIKYCLKTDTAYRYIERPMTLSKKEIVEVPAKNTKIHNVVYMCGLLSILGFALWIGVRIFRKRQQ